MEPTQYTETSATTTSTTTTTTTTTTATTATTTTTTTPTPPFIAATEIAKAREDINFLDEILTLAKENHIATCCDLETKEARNVTCGLGVSCDGQCAAMNAELSPTGICTPDPRQRRALPKADVFSVPTLDSSALAKCTSRKIRCRVKANRECCYHPRCYKRKKKICNWFRYLTGNSYT